MSTEEEAIERACVEAVAKARQCSAEPKDGQWPDGWLVDRLDGSRLPAEVVYAFAPQPGEGPGTESGSRRAWSQARSAARKRVEALGTPVSFTAHGNQPWVGRIHGAAPPPVTRPVHFEQWILAAIERKLAKKYPPCILIVCVRWPDLTGVSMALHLVRARLTPWPAAFIEIWVTNHYGDPAIRV